MTGLQTIRNSVARGLARVMPDFFGMSTKHDHARDYGWPSELTFTQFHRMYQRNGLAAAAVDKTIAKTWESLPELRESEDPAESALEAEISGHFAAKRIWQAFMNVDRRGMVGAYSGAVLLLADNQRFDQPVTRVPGGIKGLAGILPAWEGQLTVAEWDLREGLITYGQPLFYQFNEHDITANQQSGAVRSIRVHPDRVILWSEDGTIHGSSTLEPGYNDLLDAEKVKGAGGEGFWKSARGAPMITAPEGMSMTDVMKAMGAATPDEAMDAVNEQLDRFNEGFDKGLMLGGLTATPLSISLPQPEEFFNIAVQSFAASVQMPMRVLIGNQTGERASTEDAREWAMTCMSRRTNLCLPALHDFIARLVRWGILPARDWTLGWADLTEATASDKIDRAAKMAEINAKAKPTEDPPFTPDEIREVAGYEAMGLDGVNDGEDGEVLE